MNRKKGGFTFIELMVAISIIGVLMTIVVAGGSAARKSARVAQRVSDIKKVQGALDLYYANNKSYPSTSGAHRGVCPSYNGGGAYTTNNGLVIPGLAPQYINQVPADPQTSASNDSNCYLYISNGTDYAFIIHQVTELSDGSAGATYAKYPELIDPARDSGSNSALVDGSVVWAWKVSSPGGIGW